MRSLRCLLAVVVAAGLLLAGVPAAEAKRASAPVLDRPTPVSRLVVLTGRAKPRSVVAVQVRTNRWVTVRKVRAAKSGRYRSVVPAASAPRSFRVVAAGRASAARVVHPLVQAPVAAKPKPPAADACGARPAKRTGGWYSCTFIDNFNGTSLDRSRWTGHQFYGAGNRCVLDNDDTIAVSGGTLRLSAVKATGANACPVRPDGTQGAYSSGWVSTYGAWSQQYGRYEARMKVQATSLPGLHEGFWMWPDARYGSDTDWPITGEIDIAETYSEKPHLAVPFLHYSDDAKGPVDGLNTAWNCRTTRGEWHNYALEWTADRLEIFVDGKSCLVNTAGAPTFRKRFIIAFTQLLGANTNDYDGRVPLPATMQVDWVKAWQ